MRALFLGVLASVGGATIMGVLAAQLGWTANPWMVGVMNGIVFLCLQLIVRVMTYGERQNATARVIDKTVALANNKLKLELDEMGRRVNDMDERSERRDRQYSQDFQQIKLEIKRIGGRMLPMLASATMRGGAGELSGNLRVTAAGPEGKWIRAKRVIRNVSNSVRGTGNRLRTRLE